MRKIAIVDDENKAVEQLRTLLKRYETENGESFSIFAYSNAEDFLVQYMPGFDLVFMDVEMPGLTGLEAAHRLRQMDTGVAIIFVTMMIQFATEGYKVNALDHVIKPVQWGSFALALKRALRMIGHRDASITLTLSNGFRVMALRSICLM